MSFVERTKMKNIKRLAALLIVLSMVAILIPTTVLAKEVRNELFLNDTTALVNGKAQVLFNNKENPYVPADGAEGVTIWFRVEGSSAPFYMGEFKMYFTVEHYEYDRDEGKFADEPVTQEMFTYNHGQDSSRNAMWKIDGDGDYLLYIPYKPYSLYHVLSGPDKVVSFRYIEVTTSDLNERGNASNSLQFKSGVTGTTNPDATITLMGLFDDKVEDYSTDFVIDDETVKSISGSYTYVDAELSAFAGICGNPDQPAGSRGNVFESNEYYDPDIGYYFNLNNEDIKDKMEALGYTVITIPYTGENPCPAGLTNEVYRLDVSELIKKYWQIAKVDAEIFQPELQDGEVFSGWATTDGNIDIPRDGNKLYGSISSGVIVTYIDEDGETELGTEEVALNGDAKAEIVPTKEGNKFQKFTFDKWVDKNGEEVSLKGLKENVTVYATYTEEFVNAFSDVADEDWWFESVKYICSNGLMNGMTETTFEPNTTTTRAMVVKILYDNEGKPDVSAVDCPFTDLEAGAWYENAVKWAFDKGVVKGMTETTFEPNTPVTRQQFCVILHGYAEKVINLKYESYALSRANLNVFPDKDQIADWARDSLKYCTVMGCISGSTQPDGQVLLLPNDQLTRAQLASMLRRFLEFIEAH